MVTLLERYVNDDQDVLACYAGSIRSLFNHTPETGSWDPTLTDAIRAYNASMEHHPEFEGNEAVVITGQQPAVFAGPLYSIYKAITAIKLAEELSSKFQTPVIPIFWVGSEDHDFDEAATVYFPTRKHTTEPITLPMRAEYEGKALHQVSVNDDYSKLIDTLVEHTNGGEFRHEIEEFLRTSLAASNSLAEWSTRILARFFHNTSLVFFAPHLEAARRCSAKVIRQAIENPLVVTNAVNEGAGRMEALGYSAQVEKNENECAFFYEKDGMRAKVIWENDTFVLPDLDCTMTQNEMLEVLESNPERFSPNVALRCIVQQHLFPTAAYVAGPGELAYWGQFKGVFEAFQARMPIVYPRIQAMLISTKLLKLCRRYNIVRAELFAPGDELLNKSLRSITETPEIEFLTKTRIEVENLLSDLESKLATNAKVASNMAASLANDIERKMDRLETNLLRADKSRRETVENHVCRIQSMLAPNRKPQERVHTIVPYLFEHGWALRDRLMERLTIGTSTVEEVEL